MSRKTDKEKIEKFDNNSDTVMLMLFGFGAGPLLDAFLLLVLGAFFDGEKGQIWSVGYGMAGLKCIGVSLLYGVLAAIYWKFFFLRVGPIFDDMRMPVSPFWFIVAAFFSSAFICASLFMPV